MIPSFKARDERMVAYLKHASEVKECFEALEIQHIAHDQNARANALATEVSGAAMTFKGRGIIQSVGIISEVRTVDEVEPGDWRLPIIKTPQEEDLEVDKQQKQKFKRIAL